VDALIAIRPLAAIGASTAGTLLVGAAALASAVISILVWRSTRKASTDANSLQGEANRIARRQSDLDIMEATIENLRIDLAAAQEETTKLRADLAAARDETRRLANESTAALANVSILSEHIREHIPDKPFPRLRKVS
jgi:aspartokinase